MQEKSSFISPGRNGQKDVAGEMVTACPTASLLQGGHYWGGEGHGSASPSPRAEEDGEATGIEPSLPKLLCPPSPPKCRARGLHAGMAMAEPQLEGALQVQIHTHMCAHLYIGGCRHTHVYGLIYIHTRGHCRGCAAVPHSAAGARTHDPRPARGPQLPGGSAHGTGRRGGPAPAQCRLSIGRRAAN